LKLTELLLLLLKYCLPLDKHFSKGMLLLLLKNLIIIIIIIMYLLEHGWTKIRDIWNGRCAVGYILKFCLLTVNTR